MMTSYHSFDSIYANILELLLESPVREEMDRTGVGTSSIPAHTFGVDLSDGNFPLLSLKSTHWKSVVHELLWMISGSTNVKYLQDNGVTIWDEWADKDGELGPVYGRQWRDFGAGETWDSDSEQHYETYGIDQLRQVVSDLKTNPYSRRHIVTAWNPVDLPHQALPPCHILYQFYVIPPKNWSKPKLGLILYQRSCDVFLGLPFNVASYSLLTHLVAQCVGMDPGFFSITIGDMHLYNNHREQAKEVIKRNDQISSPYNAKGGIAFALQKKLVQSPRVVLNKTVNDLFSFKFEDIKLEGYEPLSAIKADVAV